VGNGLFDHVLVRIVVFRFLWGKRDYSFVSSEIGGSGIAGDSSIKEIFS
jgi:hypothetical protein